MYKKSVITLRCLSLGLLLISLYACSSLNNGFSQQGSGVWSESKANTWYKQQGWLVGPNFIPSTAINQLEMWQEDTFDTVSINRELLLARSIGMNTSRVYLHDLLWLQDSVGFLNRMNVFLDIADRHKIKPLFVLFDSCWDPYPQLGVQRAPKRFIHNSGWVQSPGLKALKDTLQYYRLERYVKGVISNFADDDRILGWDVWNEPDNTNGSSYGKIELEDKERYVLPLLRRSFIWARDAKPKQPLTSAVWAGDWSSDEILSPIQRVQLGQSDIISFHNYEGPDEFEKRIKWLQKYNRPIICTEYMARGNGSFFEEILPVAKKYNVGAFNWGLVDGKSQTKYPWDTWDKEYENEPDLWFHEIFTKEGKPYRITEVDFIKSLTYPN